MKKLVLLLALLFTGSISLLNAQVIEDFETIPMNLFSGGTNGALDVIANPDMNGNETMYVGQMDRGFDGDPWAGWYADIDVAFNPSATKYVHLWVWKPRISPIVFKLENPGTGGNTGDVFPMNEQTLTNEWEELVFDFSAFTEDYTRIVLIPDFENPLTLTEDITLYFDQMYANDDPTPGSAPVFMFEDFEHIPLNAMDESTMTRIVNPDMSGINTSHKVIEMNRAFDGVPWAGFWSALPMPVDFTDNKYVHVKVWKPRISPIKFKIEGNGDPVEVFSMNEQTMTNAWEDMVFDFSSVTGEWPTIVFMPDFEDPLTLTEDITIYFDDILLNNDPNPIMIEEGNVTLNLNMEGAIGYNSMVVFDPELHDVFVAGDPWGWPQPGSDPSLMLTSEDGIHYTGSFLIDDGRWQWKYFFVPKGESSWDHGEWDGTENRHHIIMGEATFDHVWGTKPVEFTFNVDMENADPFDPATDDVYIAGELLSNWNQPGTVEDYKLEPVDGKAMMYSITLPLYIGEHQYKYFRVINEEPSWDNGEWEGGDNRMVAVDTNNVEVFDIWGSPEAIFEYQPITFNMYPNPAGSQLTLDKLEDVNLIEVYNVVGEKVISLNNIQTEKVTLDTSKLSEGVYLITVYNNRTYQSTKFLKK
jgi:hypothetical protein